MIDTLFEPRDPPGGPRRRVRLAGRDVTRPRGIRARRTGAGRDGM